MSAASSHRPDSEPGGATRQLPRHPATSAGTSAPSDTPRPLAAAAGATFGALSRLRQARIFHPRGVGYTGTLRITSGRQDYSGVPLLERPGEYPLLLRFSRGVGLPERLPDVLGLAVRVLDAHGKDGHQDFLLVTSADGPVLHHLLLPGFDGFFGQSFSSVLLYRVGGKLRLIGALPGRRRARGAGGALGELTRAAERGDLGFRLALASLGGRWEPVGDIRVGERLPDEQTEELAFTPWNTGGAIRPAGPFMGVRRAAYRASQRARGLQDHQIP